MSYGGHYRVAPIEIEVSKEDLKNIAEALTEIENPQLGTKDALNNIAKAMQKRLPEQVVKIYRYRSGISEVKRASSIKKATVSHLIAELEYHSTVKEPRDFFLSGGMVERSKQPGDKYKKSRIRERFIMSGNNPKGVVKGAILKSKSPMVFKGQTGNAFIVRFRSGHIAVVTRDPKEVAKKYAGQAYNKHTAKLRAWQSSSPTMMVQDDKVYGALENEFADQLHEVTQKTIEKRLDKYGGA